MKIFVTGGAGFIGSNYVRGLLQGRWGEQIEQVTVFDALTYAGNLNNLNPVSSDSRFRFVHGDIRKPEEVLRALRGHGHVVHFAAESHVDRSIDSASIFMSTNVLGTQTMLDCSLTASVETFVHVSTDEVYGSIDTGSWDEACPLLPNSPYAASKASSDLVARSHWRTYGLDGDGLNVRDWLHVDDHCRGIDLVLRNGRAGETYNIGGGTELSNVELTSLILENMGFGLDMIRPTEDRKGHDRRYSVDWSKISREVGYKPQESLISSLRDIIDWYRTNESWWRPLKTK